jgi:hypothetical protein
MKKSIRIGVLWRAAAIGGNTVAQKTSVITMATIPTIATLEAEIKKHTQLLNDDGYQHGYIYNILFYINRLVEKIQITMPLNAARIFWASLFFYFCSLLYTMYYPRILDTYEKWTTSAEYVYEREAIIAGTPKINEKELQNQLESLHKTQAVNVSFFSTIALTMIYILLALGLYLISLVISSSIHKIYNACALGDLFSVYVDTCHGSPQ